MRLRSALAAGLLLATLQTVFPETVKTRILPGVVKKVVDGDTIVAVIDKKETHVRLLFIDTMESRKNGKLDRDWKKFRLEGIMVSKKEILRLGLTASSYMKSLLKPGTPVTLEVFYGNERDRYRRLLALVRQGQSLVNLELVRRGYARSYFVGRTPEPYKRLFTEAEDQARSARLGIWNVLVPKEQVR